MIATLDLSGNAPLVRVDGETLHGVTRADIEMVAHEVPVLVLRVMVFKVIGGTLPHGMHRMSEAMDHEGENS
jgi:hypothetical protein